MNSHRGIQLVLLDVDGTLLDSNDAHARSWVQTLGAYGHALAYDRVRPLIGKGGDKLLPELIGAEKSKDFKEISEARTKLFLAAYLPHLHPTRGARTMLLSMRDDGLRLAVATSAGDELSLLLRQAEVEDLFELTTSSDDAEKSKPDNDIVVAALKKANVLPCEALMIGDTPYDIEAANTAGVPCIALRCGGWWEDQAFQGALAIFDDPAAVPSSVWRLHNARG